MKAKSYVRFASWCDHCDKRSYLARKMAKNVANKHRTHYSVFQCPIDDQFWHVGRLARAILRGDMTRDEYYGKAS